MALEQIRRICVSCYNEYGSSEGGCTICNNTGDLNPPYWLDHGVNVFCSYMILEELDTTEYNALTDEQKDGVKTLLSCGLVDLNDGKAGRVRFWNWFGAESTTVANLTALLT